MLVFWGLTAGVVAVICYLAHLWFASQTLKRVRKPLSADEAERLIRATRPRGRDRYTPE